MTDREALRKLVEAADLDINDQDDAIARSIAYGKAIAAAKEVLARGEPKVVAYEAMSENGVIYFSKDDGCPKGAYNVRPLMYADEG